MLIKLGFGPAQFRMIFILSWAWFAEAAEIFLMPILSTRLYVEWNLSSSMESALGASSFAGFAISYPIWGWIADRVGRKSALIIANCWIGFWGSLCALAPNLMWLITFRLLYSLAGGVANIMCPYNYEFLAENKRWVGFFSAGVSFSLGGTYPIVLAIIFLTGDEHGTWRFFLLFSTVPVFIFLILAIPLLHESPRYLVSIGKNEESKGILCSVARQNGKKLPGKYELKPEKEIGSEESEIRESLRVMLSDSHVARCVVCILVLGVATRYAIYGMAFVQAEVLYMDGESSNYCKASHGTDYYLTTSDYLKLLVLQQSDLLSAFIGLAYLISDSLLKFAALSSMGLGGGVLFALYFCPNITIVLVVLFINRAIIGALAIVMWKNLPGILPTKLRASLFGVCTFLMYLILPVTPFSTQALATESWHYVTTVSIAFIGSGFVAGLALPDEVYAN